MRLTATELKERLRPDARDLVASRNFYYVLASMLRIGATSIDNSLLSEQLVVDVNAASVNAAAGFVPACVLLSGEARKYNLLRQGEVKAAMWVGGKALSALGITANDGISSDELNQKLGNLLDKQFPSRYGEMNSTYAYIKDIYPFDNYLIYQVSGSAAPDGGYMMKQSFSINPETREVSFVGSPSKVEEVYVAACGGNGFNPYMPNVGSVQSGNGASTTPKVGFWPAASTALGITSYPEVDDLVKTYQQMIKNGWHSPTVPALSALPVNLLGLDKELRARGVTSPMDFANWIAADAKASPEHKTIGGANVHVSNFAYVGDPKKKSTWKLPIHDAKHAQLALDMVSKTQGIPEDKKAGVLSKIKKKAKAFGIGNKTTPKQKAWKAASV